MRPAVLFTIVALLVLNFFAPTITAQPIREDHTATINGFEMHYATIGEGEPLLLLHAWAGNCHTYDQFVEEFSKQYRLIIPDLRGHGKSTNPGGTFTIRQSGMDILALLDHLELERIRALGASMGGITLYHAAIEQPERFVKLVIIGAGNTFPPPCRESMAKAAPETYSAAWWAEMRKRHVHGDEQIRNIAALLPAFAADTTDVAFTAEGYGRIQAETLLIFGDRDWCFPAGMAAEIYAAIPNAALWVVPGGGHVPITGKYAPQFVATTLTFLE